MKRSLSCYLIPLMVVLTACSQSQPPPDPTTQLKNVNLETVKIVAGQTVYVPVYSQIYMWEQRRTINLTATLSIRNTDLSHPIIITAINYYDGNGKLIRKSLEKPVELGPLAATSFVIGQEDTVGGAEASFIVEWVSQQELSSPVIESIMIHTGGNQGISFVSSGRVIKSRPASK